MGLKVPRVEQAAVQTAPGVHPLLVIQVFSGLLEHHTEEDAEESRCQDATLLHAVGDGEELGQVAVESDLAALVFMQLDHHLKEIGREGGGGGGTAETLEDQPEAFPADGVKGLGEVYKLCVQSFVLFAALFL